MPLFRVVMEGSAREVFTVEADSADDARDRWMDGYSHGVEGYGMDVDSVTLEDD